MLAAAGAAVDVYATEPVRRRDRHRRRPRDPPSRVAADLAAALAIGAFEDDAAARHSRRSGRAAPAYRST